MKKQQFENWVDKLIAEYETGRKQLRQMKGKLNLELLEDKQDEKQINSMISDMEYALEWMEKGRRPGNRRGVDRRAIYQRTALLDMDLFPSIDVSPQKRYLTEEQKKQLIDILVDLSLRERQCYLMHMARGMSYSEIANELGLSRRTIQQYVERAKTKVKKLVS
jgi:positive control factor